MVSGERELSLWADNPHFYNSAPPIYLVEPDGGDCGDAQSTLVGLPACARENQTVNKKGRERRKRTEDMEVHIALKRHP